ncbi:MAG: ATP-binding cassette domain-containing protein [Planctomycetota bacterium]|jgi:ATP-binding cassette subfamily F protein uup
MALLTVRDLHLTFGGQPLLDHAEMSLEVGERVCLVGPNGAGKSTLLKVIAGRIEPDAGGVEKAQETRIAWLDQAVPRDLGGTTFEVVASGLGPEGEALAAYHRAARALAEGTGDEDAAHSELERSGARLTEAGAWPLQNRIDELLSRLALGPDEEVASLSAGMKRRVLLGRALVQEPDVLLLDEPTNHLDIEAIRGLEDILLRAAPTLLFVTHDRVFLERLATRIVEIDRGSLKSYACGYREFLKRREADWEAEATQARALDRRVEAEEAWLRRGPKGRLARNEGRVRALMAMRKERSDRRERPGAVKASVQQGGRSGRLVIKAKGVSFAYGDEPIFQGLDTTIMRGDRVGIVGPNGAGKTTLLRVLLGQLEPGEGEVRLGSNLKIAYFDQLHAQLDEERDVVYNVGEGRETVEVGGRRRHIHGYLSDFLFTPLRARSLVKQLSGGERNRVLLARLLTRPANLLVLDEPTNDLDIQTLEVLESLLAAYTGTLLLVSHDRAFLDNVVTSTLVLEGDGRVREYVGGYEDYLRQRGPDSKEGAGASKPSAVAAAAAAAEPIASAPTRRKLTWKEQKELDKLPARIEELEAEQAAIHETMAEPSFYSGPPDVIAAKGARLKELEEQLSAVYERWEELEEASG